ncbi:hypothetical protein BL250_15455 [Erwinia sp. OLTSP20]|uniref:bestrophin-like domain n=1 Tax=unclassified Erwinia TaxID=2622719 RepID=UPI000C19FA00|nr:MULTISPECIES: hypothetical protein [unclassified Erwinia]PIJ48604.1 hypothetical protein BV501_16475 [Erwinia sp. OAMSP11]PIJ68958.1 hypothetical protein BK416_15715 [Erwinia sp. OLSSP12]PIJ78828.1 hypothetical protein BLD47_16540 [Erwinia sp. OLCASP19]PIJ79922.1 hypothetical protein BLD46_16365 [Erwinia sp. OLMTSP26]PIJ82040.1 hypothetical protein BLD49_15880 [Erwinia sp. OLMDSP33]
MIAYFLTLPAVDDILLLTVIFLLLVMSAWSGRFIDHRALKINPTGTAVVTGATLTLSGLLIGFMFSVSIRGYAARGQAEVREAQSVASVWQYSLLLPEATQQTVQGLLANYLEDRIRFFREGTRTQGQGWSRLSQENQYRLWLAIIPYAGHSATPVMASVLSVYNTLLTAQQQTHSVWKRQVPDAAWLVLMLFSMSACFLVGQQMAGGKENFPYLFILPVLTTLVLFVIAEIDLPGEGIIRITPDDLTLLSETLRSGSPSPFHELSLKVHHVQR